MHESILGLTCYNAKYNVQFMEFLICNSVNYVFSGIIKLFIKLTRHDLTNYHIHKNNAESILCPSAVTDQSWLNINLILSTAAVLKLGFIRTSRKVHETADHWAHP